MPSAVENPADGEEGEGGVEAHLAPEGPMASSDLSNFFKMDPRVLGGIEIAIGIYMVFVAVVMMALGIDFMLISMAYWGIFIYIPAGVLTIATAKKLKKEIICGTIWMHIVAALAACAGSVINFYGVFIFLFPPCHMHNQTPICHHLVRLQLSVVAFSVLEFVMSIFAASFCTAALCCSRESTVI